MSSRRRIPVRVQLLGGFAVVLVLSVTVAGRRTLAADLPWTVEKLKGAAAAVTKALEGEVSA